MTEFKDALASVKMKELEVQEEKRKIYRDAVKYVQSVIDDMGIRAEDLKFNEGTSAVKCSRTPAKVKYQLSNGDTWTGKGQMKKSFEEAWKESKLSKEEFLKSVEI